MSDGEDDNHDGDYDDDDDDDHYDLSLIKRLEEVKNLTLHSDGAVVGRDFLEVILRQMEFAYALSHRQHQDIRQLHQSVKEFTASSKRVEKLTMALIGLTVVLAIMTFFLIPR
jgi:hypothetical protein